MSVSLPRTIGGTTSISDATLINTISGYADIGLIAFDSNGTMAVCTSVSRNESDKMSYTFRVCSLNTEIDVQNILSQSY